MISTDSSLEDARVTWAFFKGRTAMAAPFLMAGLTTFVVFFNGGVVVDEIECMEGEDDHDNTGIWQLIVEREILMLLVVEWDIYISESKDLQSINQND